MFQQVSIKNFSNYLALFIAALNSILLVIILFSFNIELSWSAFGLFMVLSLIGSYILLKLFLEQVVLKRIRPIYKIIRDSKLTESERLLEENESLNKSIASVNDEVVHWAESAQREITTLKSLESYRQNFVGNISHELKTPIFSIQGYIHTLLDGGINDEKVNVKFLEKAAANATRLQTIVEDLELINNLESDQSMFQISSFEIKTLVNEVIADLESFALENNITIRWKENASDFFEVKGDREAIRQVLINLMVNSVKYGVDKGITEVGVYDLSEDVLIEVSDNGIGIEEKHIKHLFDRFYRVDKGRSRQSGGSGLGLSIVKHIIEAHGKSINVRSTINIGSTFGFTLNKS